MVLLVCLKKSEVMKQESGETRVHIKFTANVKITRCLTVSNSKIKDTRRKSFTLGGEKGTFYRPFYLQESSAFFGGQEPSSSQYRGNKRRTIQTTKTQTLIDGGIWKSNHYFPNTFFLHSFFSSARSVRTP